MPRYWNWYWDCKLGFQNIGIAIEIACWVSKILVLILILQAGFPRYWYWYWDCKYGFQDIGIDIEIVIKSVEKLELRLRLPEVNKGYWNLDHAFL